MKRIILILGVIVSGIFASCDNFADEYFETPAQSSKPPSEIFSSPQLAQGAVDGIKIIFGEDQSYRNRYLAYYGLNSDVEWYNSSESIGSPKAEMCNYLVTPTNSEMNSEKNVWAHMYAGIERANLAIDGFRKFGNTGPGTELGYLLGETITLRAILYADLLKTWGDVPARFEPVNEYTKFLAKSNREIIYKQLLKDLDEAATLVPWPNGNTVTKSTERINKAFVKGLRARLALVACGFQQYPDAVKPRRTTDPELSVDKMYALALKECREVINSGSAVLNPSFEELWKTYNQETLVAGKESLWEIPFATGRGRFLNAFANKHNTKNQFQDVGSTGGSSGPLPIVFYDYDEKDTRRNVTCLSYIYGNAVNGIAKQEMSKLNKWYFGKFRYEWFKKAATSDDGLNKLYMRYAEIVMMAAETANELEGPAAAAPYLKQIRKRAFSPADQAVKVDAYVDALTSKEAMFNAIVKEHAYEFTGEMERKMALIRWGLLAKNLEIAKNKMIELQNRTGEYADVPTSIYTKYAADNVTIKIWGLNRSENVAPPAADGYGPAVSWTWTDSGALDKANSLYRKDPDTRNFWPIWTYFIDSSNGLLVNDYGY